MIPNANGSPVRPVAAQQKAPKLDAKATLKSSLEQIMKAKTKDGAARAFIDGTRRLQQLAQTQPVELVSAYKQLKMAYDVKVRSLDTFEMITSNIRG